MRPSGEINYGFDRFPAGRRRMRGEFERILRQAHEFDPGLVIGFRGPSFRKLEWSTFEWSSIAVWVDDELVASGVQTNGKPLWVSSREGAHQVVFYSNYVNDETSALASVNVQVGCGPTIISVWPETEGTFGQAAKIEIDPPYVDGE
jgi:hypothetical protein